MIYYIADIVWESLSNFKIDNKYSYVRWVMKYFLITDGRIPIMDGNRCSRYILKNAISVFI